MNILELAIARQMSGGGGGGGGVSSWDELTGKPFDANNIIKPEALPEGYPYKEQSEQVIEWDGNTEGLVGGDGWYKVSDEVLGDLEGVAVTFVHADESAELTLTNMNFPGTGMTMYQATGVNMQSVMVVSGHASLPDGTYFYTGSISGNTVYTSKLTVSTETIHTMAPEFLPAGVGVPTVTADDNGKFLRVVNGAWVAVALESAEGGSF